MTAYILKTILCSAILFLMYFFFLQKEKIYRFNRFYFLFSVIFSFVVPLINFNLILPTNSIPESLNLSKLNFQEFAIPQTPTSPSEIHVSSGFDIKLLIYVTVTAFLFLRFIVNLSTIIIKIKRHQSIDYKNGAKLVLTHKKTVPHSFLKYIFIDLEEYNSNSIKNEILKHEITHVKQKHSLDILFLEVITIFAWINPFLFLYKNAIQLNHEFLADESVAKNAESKRTYQLLLIESPIQKKSLIMVHPFNYSPIKKRIIMLNKKTSAKKALLKQMLLIPVVLVTMFIFSTKTIATEFISQIQPPVQGKAEITQEGISEELMKEFKGIIARNLVTNKNGDKHVSNDISEADQKRLETIYFQMSKEQQDDQAVSFVALKEMVLPRSVPSVEKFESFKDPKMYGVWVDGKRVENDMLNNYKNTDFTQVSVSKLMKNAKNYDKHVYQVDLMTNDYYQRYYSEQTSKKGYIMGHKLIKQ